jgi:hypothetical protein
MSHFDAFSQISTGFREIDGASMEHFGTFPVRRGAFHERSVTFDASRGTRRASVVDPFRR